MGKMVSIATMHKRLGILDSDVQFDPLIEWMIDGVQARFDSECDRKFERVVGTTLEFDATALFVALRAVPVESVSKFELWTPGGAGWSEVSGVDYLVRSRAVLSLPVPLGGGSQRARVTYTGGYVFPDAVPAEGQTPLPGVLSWACGEQVAFWFQQKDSVGRVTSGASGAAYQTVRDVDLLPGVRAVLRRYRRLMV